MVKETIDSLDYDWQKQLERFKYETHMSTTSHSDLIVKHFLSHQTMKCSLCDANRHQIFFHLITFHTCVCIDNLVGTQKLAFKYHTDFAKISCNSPCPRLSPLGFKEEEGVRGKDESVWGSRYNQKQISGSVGVNPFSHRGL